jgi:hypothetical protein
VSPFGYPRLTELPVLSCMMINLYGLVVVQLSATCNIALVDDILLVICGSLDGGASDNLRNIECMHYRTPLTCRDSKGGRRGTAAFTTNPRSSCRCAVT